MANRFKSIDDSVFRVIGERHDGTREVLQGPYASRSVARGQATSIRKSQSFREIKYGERPEYVDIYAEETKPAWFRI